MRKTHLVLLAATLLFTACPMRNQRDKLLQEIRQVEREVLPGNFNVTLEKSQQLMNLYIAFAEAFPQDSLTPEFLFTCAAVASASQQELYAITLYQRIYDGYPDHALRPIALMHWALAYDNMGNVERAKPLYEQFLVMFPDSPFVTDVEHLLEMVDQSPEEWLLRIQELENQEKDSN
jgi:tetratricopeptide (TPR) repeat protein